MKYNITGVAKNAEGISEENKEMAIMLLLQHGAYNVRAEPISNVSVN